MNFEEAASRPFVREDGRQMLVLEAGTSPAVDRMRRKAENSRRVNIRVSMSATPRPDSFGPPSFVCLPVFQKAPRITAATLLESFGLKPSFGAYDVAPAHVYRLVSNFETERR